MIITTILRDNITKGIETKINSLFEDGQKISFDNLNICFSEASCYPQRYRVIIDTIPCIIEKKTSKSSILITPQIVEVSFFTNNILKNDTKKNTSKKSKTLIVKKTKKKYRILRFMYSYIHASK